MIKIVSGLRQICGFLWPYRFPQQIKLTVTIQGRIQHFKLGGGAHLKYLRRAEEGAKIVEVFRVKNHDFTPKNHMFPILSGARSGGVPPGSAPAIYLKYC